MNTMRVVPGHSVLPYFCRRVVPGSHLHNEREAQEAANSVDRFVNEGGNNELAKQRWSTKAFKSDIGYSVRIEAAQT